jgi:lipopolysaccharide export system protein LptC
MYSYLSRKKYKIAALTIVLICFLIALVVMAQRRSSKGEGTKVPLPPSTVNAFMALVGVRQTATKDGARQWELQAESAQLEAESGRMILDKLRVDFFPENGGKVLLTADKGFLNTKTNDIQVQGKVRIQNDQYTLATDDLSYRHTERILSSDSPVHILGQTADLEADRMVYDLDKNQARFEGKVKGNLNEKLPI